MTGSKSTLEKRMMKMCHITKTLETNESGVFSLPTNPGEELRFKAGRKD
jgi:hypothetical protein